MLSACGFEPVYGNRLSDTTLGNMIVEPIAGREGQIFKIALEDSLNPESAAVLNAPYALRVSLKRDVIPAVIADDASIRRYNVLMTADFAVIDRATSKPVYQGNARRFGSYSRSKEDYSTFVADEDISKRTLEALAQDIAQRISALKLSPGSAL
jgi:LPS-assembly lipoprotein